MLIVLPLQGAYAEFIAVLETQILRKPQAPRGLSLQVSPKLIHMVPPGLSAEQAREAFQALVLVGDIKRGDDVLVHATASGVEIATIQLTRFYGA